MRKWLIGALLALSFVNTSFAQAGGDYDAKVKAYIEKYKYLAIEEQKRSGIPAAITLAQGIHETQAGCSELATQANNHFGIKCKKEWTGETFAHTDDAPNECFRKYGRCEDSYHDHTEYLTKSPRYAGLFKLSVTDYPAWAMGLKKCGYATNPRYAQVLIKLIEDYHLQEYTYAAMNNAEIVPDQDAVLTASADPAMAPVTAATVPVKSVVAPAISADAGNAAATTPAKPPYGKEVKVNGLRAIYGHKGETPLGYAYNAGIRYSKLLDINEIDERPLPCDMYLYLERKNTRGTHTTHTVQNGESLFMIAQQEGMQIKSLMELNQLQQGEEPVAGAVLQLQNAAQDKPAVTAKAANDNRARKSAIRASSPDEIATVPTVATMPATQAATVPTVQTSKNSRLKASDGLEEKAIVKTEEPVAVVEEPVAEVPQETTATNDVATVPTTNIAANAEAKTTDPTVEESKNEYPAEAQPRYASITSPAADVKTEVSAPANMPQPDPVFLKEEPKTVATVTAPAEAMTPPAKQLATVPAMEEIKPATTKEVSNASVAVEAKPVDVPVMEEEPKDELDRLKRKFDRVVYANENAQKTAQVETPKTETLATTTPAAETKTAVVASGAGAKYYTVKKGDTGFSIAKRNGITLRQLMEWNGLDFDDIKVGQKLKVKQ